MVRRADGVGSSGVAMAVMRSPVTATDPRRILRSGSMVIRMPFEISRSAVISPCLPSRCQWCDDLAAERFERAHEIGLAAPRAERADHVGDVRAPHHPERLAPAGG